MSTGGRAGGGSDIRSAFDLGVRWMLARVRGVRADQWDAPGLGVWTVRELVAHAARGCTTVLDYLEPAGAPIELASPAEYYRLAKATPGVDDAVAARGREAARAYGADVVAGVAADGEAALAAVADAPDGSVCRTRFGVMTLDGFLATRVVEVVVHTLDLTRATGQADEIPPLPAAVALEVLVSVVDATEAPAVLRALTGRGGLDGYSVLRLR